MNSEIIWYRRLDSVILFILISFFILSLVFIYSSQQTGQYGTQNFAMKQGINYMIGFLILIFVAKLDIDQIERITWPSYIALFFIIVVLNYSPKSIAYPVLGAKRWFMIPYVGSIQPSLFVYQQPDTGMVLLYFIAIGSMLYLSG
ncbi:FtsW/RodA/SpoVE family cell cycle protein [Schinkia azotoformans]|uniref:Cell cycle protein n=1 Tax=Schinkia azotoformans LMG 9581 TaxID=1131731 RepID=K6CAG0_SCHAZ|nr:FtsW/RodA/SpoVE family cell cycle protein [Schinkia azotoformans]EKN68100.1 cell cycle protein [Schinkia azotoformans LMG 9581]MEC1638090.1 FtsW/RodA/SpoVE family cell cycle protein [Schinkia azotoformans]MEC1946476.1 FtsW/RodA/SpoVE family cell cycle protein [Schinkia azotoformans]